MVVVEVDVEVATVGVEIDEVGVGVVPEVDEVVAVVVDDGATVDEVGAIFGRGGRPVNDANDLDLLRYGVAVARSSGCGLDGVERAAEIGCFLKLSRSLLDSKT